MIHCLLPEFPPDGRIRGDAARHLHASLRVRSGEAIEILDGAGSVLPATVEGSDAREVRFVPAGPVRVHPRPVPAVTLFACVAKAAHMEFLVEKAAELAAAEVVPVLSSRCVSRPAPGSRVARWDRIAAAALEQCGFPWLLPVAPVHTWTQALDRARAFPGSVIAAALPPGTPPLRSVLASLPQGGPYALFVGPEGDFSDAELDDLRSAGARFAGLGPSVLRTETAATAALAALRLFG